jgi:hypothetical protein
MFNPDGIWRTAYMMSFHITRWTVCTLNTVILLWQVYVINILIMRWTLYMMKSLISGFRCGINEVYALLRCYTAFIGSYWDFGTAYRHYALNCIHYEHTYDALNIIHYWHYYALNNIYYEQNYVLNSIHYEQNYALNSIHCEHTYALNSMHYEHTYELNSIHYEHTYALSSIHYEHPDYAYLRLLIPLCYVQLHILLSALSLQQWFPNFFGPPPPRFHKHTHSAPLPFLKNINALLFPLLFYI